MNRRLLSIAAPALLAGAFLLPHASSQSREPTHRVSNGPPQTAGEYGTYCKGLGDFDGDGFADYGVAAQNAPYPTGLGRVYVHSGRTSALIRTFDGDQASADFGLSFADLGDIDGDSTPDLAVGSRSHDPPGSTPNAGRIRAFSGATGAVIWTVFGTVTSGNLGKTLAEISDITGDGNRDLVAGEPGASAGGAGTGRVVFLSGSTGAFIGEAYGTPSFTGLGEALATRPETALVIAGTGTGGVYSIGIPGVGTVGAVTPIYPAPAGAALTPRLDIVKAPGTGYRLLIGRNSADTGGLVNNGTVELFAIGAPTPMLSVAGVASSESAGMAVTAVRDADGDGIEEIAFMSAGGSIFTPHRVRVMTQAGVLVDDVLRDGGGGRLTSIPDVTGDGRGEWLNSIANGVSVTFECTLFSAGLVVTSAGPVPGGFVATFDISAGILNAGRPYAQVYGFSGASPGFMGLPGWPLVPLNPDDTTTIILSYAGSAMFPDALGILDPLATASTTMSLPTWAATALAGYTATTAVAVLDAGATNVVHASNPVSIAF